VGGANNVLYYTIDGGENWNNMNNANIGRTITGIHVVNDSIGWFINSPDAVRYFVKDRENYPYNSANDYWVTLVTPIDTRTDNLHDLYFLGTYGWIVGNNGSIYRTTNYGGLLPTGSISRIQSSKQKSHSPVFNMRLSSSTKGMSNISYTLNTESTLSISVYNLKGKKIASQPKRLRAVGAHSFSFKAPKGFYIVEAKVEEKSGVAGKDAKHRVFTERVLVR
jgi:hypothetical protein